MLANPLHPLNALFPIHVTLPGITVFWHPAISFLVFFSKKTFSIKLKYSDTGEIKVSGNVSLEKYTDYRFYTCKFAYSLSTITTNVPTYTRIDNITVYVPVSASLLFGDVISESGVIGIAQQGGAKLPTGITPSMSISDVIAYLKATYPTLWDGAISNDVIQQDGTIKKFIYVPVGMPDTIPKNPVTVQIDTLC